MRGVKGEHGAYLTLFFDGIYGMILLLLLSWKGYGWFIVTPVQIITLVAAGFFTNGSLVLVNYAVANGIAGISFSVANSFPVWHTLFNMIFLAQAMTSG